jgi:type IX secretion system PorP/SprF family membrane protein
MNRIIKTGTLVIALFAVTAINAQDIHFSQYTEAPVNVNPALVGSSYDSRAIINYRSQWGSVAKSYQTYGITVEQSLKRLKLKKKYLAMGFNMYSDKAGDAKLGTLTPNLALAIHTKAAKFAWLSGGIQAGFVYRTIDISNLKWGSQYNDESYVYNASAPSGELTPKSGIVTFDAGAGVNFHYAKSERYISAKDGAKCDIGFSTYHYNLPKNSFFLTSERLATKYIFHANLDYGLKSVGIALVPSLIYMKQGPSTEITLGMMFKYIIEDQATYTNLKNASSFSFGAYYRVKDAIIPCILYQKSKYAIGISYDINVSQLTPASKLKGGLEICLRYNTSSGYGKMLGTSVNRPTYK